MVRTTTQPKPKRTARELAYIQRKTERRNQIAQCYKEHNPKQIRFARPMIANHAAMIESHGEPDPVLPIHPGRRHKKNRHGQWITFQV